MLSHSFAFIRNFVVGGVLGNSRGSARSSEPPILNIFIPPTTPTSSLQKQLSYLFIGRILIFEVLLHHVARVTKAQASLNITINSTPTYVVSRLEFSEIHDLKALGIRSIYLVRPCFLSSRMVFTSPLRSRYGKECTVCCSPSHGQVPARTGEPSGPHTLPISESRDKRSYWAAFEHFVGLWHLDLHSLRFRILRLRLDVVDVGVPHQARHTTLLVPS